MAGQKVTIPIDINDSRTDIVAKSTNALINGYPDVVIESWEIIEPDEQIVFWIVGSVSGADYAS